MQTPTPSTSRIARSTLSPASKARMGRLMSTHSPSDGVATPETPRPPRTPSFVATPHSPPTHAWPPRPETHTSPCGSPKPSARSSRMARTHRSRHASHPIQRLSETDPNHRMASRPERREHISKAGAHLCVAEELRRLAVRLGEWVDVEDSTQLLLHLADAQHEEALRMQRLSGVGERLSASRAMRLAGQLRHIARSVIESTRAPFHAGTCDGDSARPLSVAVSLLADKEEAYALDWARSRQAGCSQHSRSVDPSRSIVSVPPSSSAVADAAASHVRSRLVQAQSDLEVLDVGRSPGYDPHLLECLARVHEDRTLWGTCSSRKVLSSANYVGSPHRTSLGRRAGHMYGVSDFDHHVSPSLKGPSTAIRSCTSEPRVWNDGTRWNFRLEDSSDEDE